MRLYLCSCPPELQMDCILLVMIFFFFFSSTPNNPRSLIHSCVAGWEDVCTVLVCSSYSIKPESSESVSLLYKPKPDLWLGSAASFYQKHKKKNPLCYFLSPADCAGVCSYVQVIQRSGVQGVSAPCVGVLAPGWAERHVAPGAPVTSQSAEPVFIGNTHPNAPTHANSCLCDCVSLMIS